jgi:putative DNA primase/helicase
MIVRSLIVERQQQALQDLEPLVEELEDFEAPYRAKLEKQRDESRGSDAFVKDPFKGPNGRDLSWDKVIRKVMDNVQYGVWEQLSNEVHHAQQGLAQWKSLEDLREFKLVMESLQEFPELLVDMKAFDPHKDLLNVGNGVVDLRTGELLPHDPAYLFTKISAVEYHEGFTSPRFDQALDAVPENVRPWLQEQFGSATTGYAGLDHMTLLHGGGSNAKSTLLAAVQGALGEFYVVLDKRALMGGVDHVPTERMTLQGARCAVLEELPDDGHLDATAIKGVVGTPIVTGRRMRSDDIAFRATHTLFISTNTLPSVAQTDHGTWRRLLAVPFPFTFNDNPTHPNERKGDLRVKEAAENGLDDVWEAALAWMVEGATRVLAREGEAPALPDEIQGLTQQWRRSADLMLQFVEDRLTDAPSEDFHGEWYVTTEDMLAAYNDFAQALGKRPINANTLKERLSNSALAAGFTSLLTAERFRVTKNMRRSASNITQNTTHKSGALARGFRGVRIVPEGDAITREALNDVTAETF